MGSMTRRIIELFNLQLLMWYSWKPPSMLISAWEFVRKVRKRRGEKGKMRASDCIWKGIQVFPPPPPPLVVCPCTAQTRIEQGPIKLIGNDVPLLAAVIRNCTKGIIYSAVVFILLRVK
jgi:hypothetical protein